jgi:preprotein translocase subunit YajC
MAFLIQLVAIIAIFYFILIVPHRREQKRHREMIAALKKGDEVVTNGGLIGEIVQMGDEKLTIKSGEARVVVERARIARLASEPATGKR